MERMIKEQTHFNDESVKDATIIMKLNEVIRLLMDHERRIGNES
jgi:hypothetical protein